MKTSTTTALYRFFDADGALLYVGITHRLNERLSAHKKQKPWQKVARVEVEHYTTRQAAENAERQAIQTEHPKWNVIYRIGEGNRSERSLPVTTDSLVGHFYHSFKVEPKCGCRLVHNQGQVLAELAPGYYLVETYEWLMGEPYDRKTIPLGDMLEWSFYSSDHWMRWQYQNYWQLRTDRCVENHR